MRLTAALCRTLGRIGTRSNADPCVSDFVGAGERRALVLVVVIV